MHHTRKGRVWPMQCSIAHVARQPHQPPPPHSVRSLSSPGHGSSFSDWRKRLEQLQRHGKLLRGTGLANDPMVAQAGSKGEAPPPASQLLVALQRMAANYRDAINRIQAAGRRISSWFR